jgi:hypothetical protein
MVTPEITMPLQPGDAKPGVPAPRPVPVPIAPGSSDAFPGIQRGIQVTVLRIAIETGVRDDGPGSGFDSSIDHSRSRAGQRSSRRAGAHPLVPDPVGVRPIPRNRRSRSGCGRPSRTSSCWTWPGPRSGLRADPLRLLAQFPRARGRVACAQRFRRHSALAQSRRERISVCALRRPDPKRRRGPPATAAAARAGRTSKPGSILAFSSAKPGSAHRRWPPKRPSRCAAPPRNAFAGRFRPHGRHDRLLPEAHQHQVLLDAACSSPIGCTTGGPSFMAVSDGVDVLAAPETPYAGRLTARCCTR